MFGRARGVYVRGESECECCNMWEYYNYDTGWGSFDMH